MTSEILKSVPPTPFQYYSQVYLVGVRTSKIFLELSRPGSNTKAKEGYLRRLTVVMNNFKKSHIYLRGCEELQGCLPMVPELAQE